MNKNSVFYHFVVGCPQICWLLIVKISHHRVRINSPCLSFYDPIVNWCEPMLNTPVNFQGIDHIPLCMTEPGTTKIWEFTYKSRDTYLSVFSYSFCRVHIARCYRTIFSIREKFINLLKITEEGSSLVCCAIKNSSPNRLKLCNFSLSTDKE